MNYYRVLLFCALHLLLYNVHHLLPDTVNERTPWQVFDTCKSAIIATAPLLIWCKPSLLGAVTLFVHFVYTIGDVINTGINGDTGRPDSEVYSYFGIIAFIFIIRVWFGDSQIQYWRVWRNNTKRKFKRQIKLLQGKFARVFKRA